MNSDIYCTAYLHRGLGQLRQAQLCGRYTALQYRYLPYTTWNWPIYSFIPSSYTYTYLLAVNLPLYFSTSAKITAYLLEFILRVRYGTVPAENRGIDIQEKKILEGVEENVCFNIATNPQRLSFYTRGGFFGVKKHVYMYEDAHLL